MSATPLDILLLKNYTDNIDQLREDCALRLEELKQAIRESTHNRNIVGGALTKASAQRLRTMSKRDIAMINLLDALLANIGISVRDKEPARLQLSPNAYKGIERLLYPCRRFIKKEDKHD